MGQRKKQRPRKNGWRPLAEVFPQDLRPAMSAGPSSGHQPAAGSADTSVKTFRMSDYGKGVRDKLDQGDQVFSSVQEFVNKYVESVEKRRPIHKILVATNGIAAVKCILSIRKLLMQLFRDDRIIKFICLTTEHEIRSNAEYLKLADFFVFSPGGDNKNNYANVDEIVSHAVENKVDAVWAGWGHASENPELPKQLAARDIMFIGPPSDAMFSLGDKIASTIIAQTLNIPTIEWSGSGLKLDLSDKPKGQVEVTRDLFEKACVSNVYEGLKAMDEHKIGYPMMIKASEGGGGKGIRKCKNEADFRENFIQVQTEVPGSPIFLMKCVENARHIEVQLIADRYGRTIPIYTRDCSIQRRCQKIIEEAPASIAPQATLKSMQQDAVKIAELVGYESAGTVEYMYLPEEDKYFFLELNPRLQVEHPCTEMLASVNIPAIQLQIAMGLPLHRIVDIRLFYGLGRYDDTQLPAELVKTDTEYAVIAARITSEDPEDFFRPSTGSVVYLNFRSAQNVWGYFSVSSAGKVHEFADSQFGHLFARGRTRHEAVSVMLCALQELELRASFTSQVSYLVDLLKEPDFTENKFNTQWLDNRIANKVLQKAPLPNHEMIALSAAVIGHSRIASAFNNFKQAVERGQVLPTTDLTQTFVFDLVKDMSIYKLQVTRAGPLIYLIDLNGGKTEVEIRLLGDGSLLVTHRERSYTCHLDETTDKFKVTIGRSLVVFEKDNDPTVLKSPYTGKLLSYKKANHEWLGVGTIYASIESMKLVFNVEVKKAPGRLERVAKEGDLLYPGSVIARLVDQKDSEKYKPQPFVDKFEEWEASDNTQKNVTEPKKFTAAYERCVNILNGSIPPGQEKNMDHIVDDLFSYLEGPTLATAMCKTAMNTVQNRLPEKFLKKLRELSNSDHPQRFQQMRETLDDYFLSIQTAEFETARAVCNSLYTTLERLQGGQLSHTAEVLNQLLVEYKTTESYFEDRTYDDAVALLNEKYETDKDMVVSMIYSHTQLEGKNKIMLALLRAVEHRGMHLVSPLAENLREIGNMFHAKEVSEFCRRLLLQNSHVKYRKFVNKVLWDARNIALVQRDDCEILSVDNALRGLGEVLRKRVAENGITPVDVLNISPWMHKVLHEFFFDDCLGDLAVRAYIALHFNVSDVAVNPLPSGATVYNFCIDGANSALLGHPDTIQHICIVKFKRDSDLSAVTSQELIGQFVQHCHSHLHLNGRKCTLRVSFLLEVTSQEDSGITVLNNNTREALLEELPVRTEAHNALLSKADSCASEVESLLANQLSFAQVYAHVLVCKQNRPLMQLDMLAAEQLELWRLPAEASVVSDRLSSLHVFKYDDSDGRFARLYVREVVEIPIREDSKDYFDTVRHAIVSQLDEACGAINVTMRRYQKNTYIGNHVFLYVTFPKMQKNFTKNNNHLPDKKYEDDLDEIFEEAIREQRAILYKHHVTQVEIVMPKVVENQLKNRRLVFQDETGVTPEFGVFDEDQTLIEPKKLSHQLYGSKLAAHPRIRKIEKKRASTRVIGTTYVYDFPTLFGRAVMERWHGLQDADDSSTSEDTLFERQFKELTPVQQEAYLNSDYRPFFEEVELVVKNDLLVKVTCKEELRKRADNCNNETGVVAWELKLFTPEKPQGYSIVVIANDITFQSGSFATPEDAVYSMASEYSRKNKLPRVNVSSNSGARIGLAEDVSKKFLVKLKDPTRPEEGFDYLYVPESEEQNLKGQIVYDKMPNGLLRLKAVIGRESENIGVENLQGSGLIAGETSAAYDEVPTYCFVTGRSVGIGAYTARLARRIVQARNSHLILTGAPALNTLLGKEIYTSNNQLGGTQIMFKNGVTHAVVEDDFEGIAKIVHWMSYLPTESPVFPYMHRFGVDSAPRPVKFAMEHNKSYDIRRLIDSRDSDDSKGICDCNSFNEIMSEWAKTIVAGRARLGGIPIGVVASELRNVKTVIPADPACPNSESVEVHQAGQVWYPDSAFKTAEVISDFNREGVPLLFIASLRGFSGGQQDMFNMVLKFGADIVDSLRQYKMPVIVYIPCNGELRGGAWAVLDSKINPGFIHMVADEESRGGILEPAAIVGIKFRGPHMLNLQKRNDEILRSFEKDLAEINEMKGPKSGEAANIMRISSERAASLNKSYRSFAVEFADLHDRADRMMRKGAVQHVTSLKDCRNLFTNIILAELAKINILESYLECVVKTRPTRLDAYTWVCSLLEEYKKGTLTLPPGEQIPVLKEFAQSQMLCNALSDATSHHGTRAMSEVPEERRVPLAEGVVAGLSDEELLNMFNKVAAQRKLSLPNL